MAADYGVPLVKAKKVNAADKVALVESWRPDLIISIYCNQLIRAKLINLAPQGAINVHPALLPKNRGLFPYFWALTNGDAETGVTVHWMDTKFDTGEILLQEKLPIAPDDTVISLARKSAELGADLLSCAVKLIQQGEPPRLAQDTTQVSYFSWPTAADVHRFRQQGRRYGSITEMWKDLV
jgi:methionyl-tRNA formyltransferase